MKYTLKDYKKDGKTLLSIIKKQYKATNKTYEKNRKQRIAIQERMNAFSIKNFVGKYMKFNEYKFSSKGKIVETITHYIHPTKVVEYIIMGKKCKFLHSYSNLTPLFDYGVTAGKYYTNNKSYCQYIDSALYLEEITKEEWDSAYKKIISMDEENRISDAMYIIGNNANKFMSKNPTKEMIKAEKLKNKLHKLWQEADNEYHKLFDKEVNKLKNSVTEKQFNNVLKKVKTYGWNIECDLFKKRKTRK